MKSILLITLVILSSLLAGCKVQQVDLSKLYNSCWADKPDNGLDTELKFYENHTAVLKSTAIFSNIGKVQSTTNYSYVYLDGKIILTLNEPESRLQKNLYAIIKGDAIKISKGELGYIVLKKQE